MSESLDRILEEQFRGTTNEQLTRRMETAPDFGYDDEIYELDRRLKIVGKAWKWSQKYGRDVVVICEPEEPEIPSSVELGYD